MAVFFHYLNDIRFLSTVMYEVLMYYF